LVKSLEYNKIQLHQEVEQNEALKFGMEKLQSSNQKYLYESSNDLLNDDNKFMKRTASGMIILVGTIKTIDTVKFIRSVFRISKGKAHTSLKEVNLDEMNKSLPPDAHVSQSKSTFLIIFYGEKNGIL